MRFALWVSIAFLAAPAAAQEGFETKIDCLDEFATATRTANTFGRLMEYQDTKMEPMPEGLQEEKAAIIEGYEKIVEGYEMVAEALFVICAAYD